MWNKINLSIFVLLIPLVLNKDILPYQNVELNHGTDKYKLKVDLGVLNGIRIFTKIESSSKITVSIISEKPIKENTVFFDRATKVGGSTSKTNHPTFTSSGKTYYCIYSVKKEDDYQYGVLILTDIALEDFFDEITISVTVVSETTFWIYVVIVGVILLLLIIGMFVVCKYFYRCVCCKK